MKRWRKKPDVHQVTDARPSLSADIQRREVSYLIKMGIRTICLILAVVVPVPWPYRLLFIAGAVFLPYIAVIGANERGMDVPPPTFQTPEANQSEIPRHRREIGS
ncbi:hypothetical protein GCM10010149_09560 [Nonomuraea roseoviolacea subsp. roseoviolacea]|uniref:DUF3099 domain-containing protein n=2 Tax=Nonomuraea TaxID=83681 RepID=A0A7Y6INZ2_9ACTN|nr:MULTISPECIES: DUF3099 domain-containing protein [Nonomuraea]MCP2350894.1 hypothetical protein [Nonomuraea roseoviolacea subsp. carminata]NUW41711.1 DUF3099 domain-containing protein [Nonomuraea rhodomycinica]